MKENDRNFVIPKESKAIPGIKKLARAEYDARNGGRTTAMGVWYVDGIPYDVYALDEAHKMRKQHEMDIQQFNEFNERINKRGGEKI